MKKKQWFENESFWLNYAPVMFDEIHWAEAKGVAERCVLLAELKEKSRVLDACCGLGRISVERALLNMDVTGVDITEPFLEVAAGSAKEEGVSLTLVNADMRAFSVKEDQRFDAAINVYNSFGYCQSVQEDFQILQSIYSSLKEGGTFILECISRETAVRWFCEGEWFERAGKTVLTKFSVEGAWEGLRSKWILLGKDGSRMEHEFVQRLYSAPELRDGLLNMGFSSVQVYGGFDLSAYDYNAKTMVIVAKK